MQKKLIICLGIAMVIGLVSSIISYGMKRPRPEIFPEEHITQHENIQSVISQKFQQFPEIQNAITFLAESPIVLQNTSAILSIATNGDIVVTGSHDGTAKIWDSTTGQQLIPYADHNSPVRKVAISGDIIVSASRDDTVNIWKTDGELLHTFKDIAKEAISGDKVATQSLDDTINIWKTDGELLRTFKETGTVIIIISGDKVITGSTCTDTINIWSITTGQLLHTLKNFDGRIATSNDKMIRTISDVTAEIRDINTGKLLRTLVDPVEIFSIAIAGDKAITSIENTAKIWDINTGKLLRTLAGHTKEILDVATNGNKVVTRSTDKTIIWDINTGQLLHTFVGGGLVAIANDTMTTTRDNIANIWNIDPFKGTPENNPLLWIINNATVPQLDFIKRAYKAIKANEGDKSSSEETIDVDEKKEFIITFPSEDAKVFLSFPTHVKQYLLARLKIRR